MEIELDNEEVIRLLQTEIGRLSVELLLTKAALVKATKKPQLSLEGLDLSVFPPPPQLSE